MAKQKPETRWLNKVYGKLPPTIYRMKNHNIYTGGVPDHWLSGHKADWWLEGKYLASTPVRKEVAPEELLSALQLEWLDKRHAEGRHVGVLIGCPDGGVLLLNGEWHARFTAEEYRARLQPVESLAASLTFLLED